MRATDGSAPDGVAFGCSSPIARPIRSDPVFSLVDGRSGRLVPPLAQARPGSAAATVEPTWPRTWAAAWTSCSRSSTSSSFAWDVPISPSSRFAQALMAQAGLRSDGTSIRQGIDLVRSWVLDGRRVLSRDEVQAQIDSLDIGATEPGGSSSSRHSDTTSRRSQPTRPSIGLSSLKVRHQRHGDGSRTRPPTTR